MKRLTALILSIILILGLCGCSVEEASSALGNFLDESVLISEVVTVEEYYIVSPEFDACYKTLNKKQKELYRIFYSAAKDMTEGFFRLCKKYDGVKRDMALAYEALNNDHPEFFWLPRVYLFSERNMVTHKEVIAAFEFSSGKNKTAYTVSKAERDKMKAELDEKVEAIVREAEQFESEYEKEKFFNDYICKNTVYDKDASFSDTPYACLVLGKALCEGYSKAFKILCNKVGIECDLVVGIAEGDNHMWNLVNIDGKHSYVDVTWNDSGEGMEHVYFNITSNQLKADHEISPLTDSFDDNEIENGGSYNFFERDCGYTGNTFYAKDGRVLEDSSFAEIAADKITKDSKTLRVSSFMLSDEQKDEFSKDAMKYIAKIQKKLSGIVLEEYIFQRDILILFFSVYA